MIFRDQLILSFIISFILISCSSENESDSMITPPSSETFGSWSPNFSNQTNNFTQTRKGSNGSTDTRTINISSSTNSSSSFEKNINIDVNNDGDMLDEINITTITYTANNNLGSHQQTDYEILNDLNNYFKIGENKFSIKRVVAENYLNQGTCNGIPTYFSHYLTFYSETENEEIYIEFFNNDSEQLKSGDYKSLFSYLNPFLIDPQSTTMEFEWYIDDMSNQEKYDLYNSYLCSDSEYNLITSFEVEFQGNYYDVDLEENFNLDIDLENETYTVSMTGYIRQDSDNLASEKVELFYEGSLDFEVYDDNQPEEINDFLDPNYDQSIDDLNLNVLYDSKYHLDGRIKDEESGLRGRFGNRIDNGKLFYFGQSGTRQSPTGGYIETIIEYNHEDDSYTDYPKQDHFPSIKNDFNYFSGNLLNYTKLDNNYNKIEEFVTSEELLESQTENLGPSDYFTRNIGFPGSSAVDEDYYSKNYIDNNENVFCLITIWGQDAYGDDYRNDFLIKYDLPNSELVWSKEIIINSPNYSHHLELNSSQDHLVMYGEIGSSPYVILINPNNGEFMYNELLYNFTGGNPQLLGFYEDDEKYLFYGPKIVTVKIDKNTLVNSFFYTEEDNFDTIFCENTRAQVRGIEKYYDNYLFLTSTHIDDPSHNLANANETYNIEIRDSNGDLLKRFDLRNNRVGKPYGLHKIDDNTFVGLGDKHRNGGCTFSLPPGPGERLIKFNLNYSSNSDKSISSKKNFFSKKSIVKK